MGDKSDFGGVSIAVIRDLYQLRPVSILFFCNYCLHDPTSYADFTYRVKIKFLCYMLKWPCTTVRTKQCFALLPKN